VCASRIPNHSNCELQAAGIAGGVVNPLQRGKLGHEFIAAGVTNAASPAIGRIDSQLGQMMVATTL